MANPKYTTTARRLIAGLIAAPAAISRRASAYGGSIDLLGYHQFVAELCLIEVRIKSILG